MFNLIALLAWLCVLALTVCFAATAYFYIPYFGMILCAGVCGGAFGLAISVNMEA